MDPVGVTDLAGTLSVLLEQLVPGLRGGFLAERRARVLAVHVSSGPVDAFTPQCAVDVQPLTSEGQPDGAWPAIGGIAWPIAGAGVGRGAIALPSVGAVVGLRFLYGDPTQPAVSPLGWLGAAAAPSGLDPSRPGAFVVRQPTAELLVLDDGTVEATVGGGTARLTLRPNGAIEIEGASIAIRGPGGTLKALATEDHVAQYLAHTHVCGAGNSGPPVGVPAPGALTTALRGA